MAITEKNKLKVVAYVGEYWLEGDVHILPGSRLTDALNVKAKDFLAFTDVKIFEPQSGKVLYAVDYAAVNRANIKIIFPIEASTP